MSKLFVDQVDPKTATSLTLGTSGDTVNIPSGVTLANAGTVTGLPASAISSGTIDTARLGSGTASSSTVLYGDQTYKTAPSGGLAYVGGGSTTSNVAAVNLDNVFSATYDNYLLVLDMTSNGNGDAILHFRSAGGSPATQTAANYSYGFAGMDSAGGTETIHSTNDSRFQMGHGMYNNTELDYPAFSGYIFFNSPFSSSHTKPFHGTFINEASNGEHRSFPGGGLFKNQVSCGGVRLSFSSDSVNNCTARMYGLVNS